MDEYSNVCRNKLHIKTKNDSSIKKKKKSKKQTRERIQKILNEDDETQRQCVSATNKQQLTKAEIAFKQQQEKMKNKRILERASTTHKERVEKFNEHLDTLTEHFDIPKVSWTK